ncbi:hypothetical protein NPM06_27065 [Bacillus cereus]|uniref:hypothetical protein n=1 Tax=Bacillus cereus TaxID=1396 RepID=UPI0021124383|nr:hypothetical protein [Bacillus cereus]
MERKKYLFYRSEVDVMEPFLWIAIFILLGQIVCIKMDLKYLEKRLDTYQEMLDIQNEKIDDSWRYFNKR